MESPKPDREEIMFFACIGRLAVAWGHLEMGLDMIISITLVLGGSEIEPERPRALNRKLRYLRRYFLSSDMPEPGKQAYLKLLEEIRVRSDFRHDIIHGAITRQDEKSFNTRFVRAMHINNKIAPKPVDVDTKTILREAKEVEVIASKTFKWSDAMADAMQQLAREAGVQIP